MHPEKHEIVTGNLTTPTSTTLHVKLGLTNKSLFYILQRKTRKKININCENNADMFTTSESRWKKESIASSILTVYALPNITFQLANLWCPLSERKNIFEQM